MEDKNKKKYPETTDETTQKPDHVLTVKESREILEEAIRKCGFPMMSDEKMSNSTLGRSGTLILPLRKKKD